MKRSSIALFIALPVLPLVFTSACGEPPDGDAQAVVETNGAISSPPHKVPNLGPTLVDFDTSPSGAVAAGTLVDTTYASQGVTFTCVSCSSGHAYAEPRAVGNNAVTLFTPPSPPGFDARFGAVKSVFATPATSVSIQAIAVPTAEYVVNPVAKPFLEAFDASNNLLVKVLYQPDYGDANYGTAQTLTVTSSTASIAYVVFSSQAPGNDTPVLGVFDNLRFYSGPLVGL